MVLKLLQQHRIYPNRKKCHIGSKRVEYLGHIISSEGVSADKEKIRAMEECITRPLTNLLQKDQFQWGKDSKEAFERLKRAMTMVPVVSMPDFNALFVVELHASGSGLGEVLMQNQKPIAYFSQALSERQKMNSVSKRKLMAIVFDVQKWRHYLIGRKFVVITDQKTLRFLLEQREVNLDYQRWLTNLLLFDFEIKYKLGLENRAEDALSRKVITA
ncbi:hypothetical protein N665_0532s0015 [Sinapis alba]|nr:hypothetical protein N665_0532s0015 [Sinapis alba]